MSSNLEPFWAAAQKEYAARIPRARLAVSRDKVPRITTSRVAQLDAQLLDNELELILTDPLLKSLKLFGNARLANYQEELLAVVRYFLLKTSLVQYSSSYGDHLQNIKYPSLTPLQREAYCVLSILPDYAIAKLRDAMIIRGWSDYPYPKQWNILLPIPSKWLGYNSSEISRRLRQRKRMVWEMFLLMEKGLACARLANFVLFLYNGQYRSLIDRLLKMQLRNRDSSLARFVSFEYMNRQLVWETITDFLFYMLPLINFRKLRMRLSKALYTSFLVQWLIAKARSLLNIPAHQRFGGKGNTLDESTEEEQGPFKHLDPSICPICYSKTYSNQQGIAALAEPGDPTDPTSNNFATSSNVTSANSASSGGSNSVEDAKVKVPYSVNCCGGMYCYYCVTSELAVWEEETAGLEGDWLCLRCGKGVQKIERAHVEQMDSNTESS